jgi:hypothetical protein
MPNLARHTVIHEQNNASISSIFQNRIWGEVSMGGADTSPTSLIVNLWIYTIVPITALNTKEFGSTEWNVLADARLANSRD